MSPRIVSTESTLFFMYILYLMFVLAQLFELLMVPSSGVHVCFEDGAVINLCANENEENFTRGANIGQIHFLYCF